MRMRARSCDGESNGILTLLSMNSPHTLPVFAVVLPPLSHHRCLLQGFPAPESPYWTEQTLAWVRQRYERLPGGFLHTAEIEDALALRVRKREKGREQAKRKRDEEGEEEE